MSNMECVKMNVGDRYIYDNAVIVSYVIEFTSLFLIYRYVAL